MTWARFRPTYKNIATALLCSVAIVGLFALPVHADAASDCNGKYTGTGKKVAEQRAACVKGYGLKTKCADLPKGANTTKAEIKAACDFGFSAGTIAVGADTGAGAIADAAKGDDEAVCSAGALGWIFCPLTDFISTATTKTAELLESQLVFRPLTSTQGNAIRAIWGIVLGIANAGLVIAFLVVIFSQSTSIGLSKYGIKKILPRIIAVAILMNLSFWICAIAVDISNILGVSIRDIINAGMSSIGNSTTDVDLKAGASFSQALTAIIGSLLVAVTAAALGLMPLLLPILAAGLVAVVTAFIILAARQVLIMLLIIVAPIAILAWVLPNTEEWFTKWRKFFVALLLMFPIIMGIFYGSLLVSKVILATGEGGSDGDVGFMTNLIAFVVLIVPLFSLPFIMKTAGGVLDRFGLLLNNRSKGIIDRSRKKGQELSGRSAYQRGRELRKRAADEYRGTKFASRLGKGGSTGVLARGVAGNVGRIKGAPGVYGAQGARLNDYAVAAERKAASERRQAITAGLRSEGVNMEALQQRYLDSVSSGDTDSATAQLSHLATTYGSGGRSLAAQALESTDLSAISNKETRQKMRTELNETIGGELYGSLIGSRADVAKGMFESDKFKFADISKLTAPQIASQDGSTDPVKPGVHAMAARRPDAKTYNADEAYIAMTNPDLTAKVLDSGTRAELSRISGVPLRSSGGSSTSQPAAQAQQPLPPGAGGGTTGWQQGQGGLVIPRTPPTPPKPPQGNGPGPGNSNQPPNSP